MDSRRSAVWVARCVPLAAALSVTPQLVRGHQVVGSRFSAPLPLPLLLAGGGVTVGLTALWLAGTARSTPTLHPQQIVTIPAWLAASLRYGARILFATAVAAALIAGLRGRQVAAENLATLFTWPVWFRGVALVAVLLGSPWRLLSPWRAIYSGLVRLDGRELSLLGSYPAALASWPATGGFVLLLGIGETLTIVPQSPRLTTVIISVYAVVMLAGAVCYGPTWFQQADPLGVFYRLFGRVAPLTVTATEGGGYSVSFRSPWRGCLDPLESNSLVVFVIATVYTVSFDGFTNTTLFQSTLFGARELLSTGPQTSVVLYAAGLAGFVGIFGVGMWAVERLGAVTPVDWLAAARSFAPTVLPIAATYEVAHNYPYVIRNLAQLIVVAGRRVGLAIGNLSLLDWLSLPMFWGSQVVLIVVGHVIAVVAAHYVAIDRYDAMADARRGHLPLVVLMIGYTMLSLWIVSQPVIT